MDLMESSTESKRTLESSEQLLCSEPSTQGGQNTVVHQQHSQHPPTHGTHSFHTPPINHVFPSSSPPHDASHHKPHHPYRNEDLINQNNEHYKQLRARAVEEGNEMAKCFEESHHAYEAHNGALAKELSNKAHAHQKKMNELNAQASDWIFKANNTDSGPGEIDLHGLYVREAISHTERAIQEAQARGDREIRLIVGKGIHSTEHVSKLEPAIEELMQRYHLAAHLEEHNSGVLVVALDGQRNDRSLQTGDITQRLESKDGNCVIM